MRSSLQKKLQVAPAVIAALVVGCSTTPPPAATHNLERPSDLAFACVGAFDDGGDPKTYRISGRPMSECHPSLVTDPLSDLAHHTFGFVANSARGELSVIDMDSSKLVDLDLVNPGTNVAPLGVLPEQIAASDDGCRIVSANHGSCDLTLVDVGTLLSRTLASEDKVTVNAAASSSFFSQDVVVRGSSGRQLRLSPQEVIFLPQDTSPISGTANLCARDRPFADPVGWNATPLQPIQTQWKALVTYPTCNLVALVDLPSGNVVDSMKVSPSSDGTSVVLSPAGSDPDCPVQDFCDGRPSEEADAGAPTGDASADTSPDASSDAGAATGIGGGDPFVNPTGTRPGPMAILPQGQRVYVGLAQAAFVVALDVNPNHLAVPAAGGVIALHEGALGVDRVRLSVDPYQATGRPGQLGRFVGEGIDRFFGEGFDRQRQYLYAIARDGTVRVVDVSARAPVQPGLECDTNLDPQFFPVVQEDPSIPDRAHIFCWPADPPDFAHRRPFTRGPGISLLPAIARDVAFADLTLGNSLEAVLDGSYGFILTSTGAVSIVNIDPTLRTTVTTATTSGTVVGKSPLPEEQPLVSSLRDHNVVTYAAGQDPTVGPARLDLAPSLAAQGPQIQAVTTNSVRDNATLTTDPTVPTPTYVFFPQRSAARRQTWNVTWQGDLVSPSFFGQFSQADKNASTTAPATLKDIGVDFCQLGVLAKDFVTIYGCTVDAQCGPLQVCKRNPSAPEIAGTLSINGLCVPLDPKNQADQILRCDSLLTSIRRYEIVDATPGSLTLQPKVDEIVSPDQNGCAAQHKAGDSCSPESDPGRSAFTCVALDATDPNNLRCVQKCSADLPPCRPGRVCVANGFCADGPVLTDALVRGCGLNQLTGYKVGAGNGFLVQGTAPTSFVPGSVNTAGHCVRNPALVNRIPLVYDAAGDGTRSTLQLCTNPGVEALATDMSNADAINTELRRLVGCLGDDPATCENAAPPTPDPCLIADSTPGVKPIGGTKQPFRALFRNREITFILTGLETYLADSALITFDVHGGFLAESVSIPTTIDVEMPNRIVLSPIDSQTQAIAGAVTHELPYLFVVDQRRLGRASAGVGATRGQILRINPRRNTTTDVTSLLPIYDDLTASGGFWPIQ